MTAACNDPKIRENFIERIFTLQRWRRIASGRSASAIWWTFMPGINF